MKKFFAIAMIAAALTSCGGSETKTEETTTDSTMTTVDSTMTTTVDTTTMTTVDSTKTVDTTAAAAPAAH